MNVKISIITVCFNSEKTIEKTIQSVISQTYQNFEYIIVDGASTDGTMEIVRRYAEKYPVIHAVSEPDSGIYEAMNKGIRMAQGELIGLLNSNDYYEPDALETMCQFYDGAKHAILYGIQRNFDETGEFTSVRFIHHSKLDKDMITHPTCFVTRSVYNDFGLFDTSYRSASDYDFMLRMNRHAQIQFKPVYKVITNFAAGGISSSVVGKIETHRIKYKYHIISAPKLYIWNMATYVKQFVKRLTKA